MRHAVLGRFGDVSRLTLGGGGLGELWGETTKTEAILTVGAALEAGVTLIDTAPSYRNCEAVIGEAFGGSLPEGVRITTKCQLGEPPRGTAAEVLKAPLEASLKAMRLDRVDLFLLHSNLCEPGEVYARFNERRSTFATPWPMYVEEAAPALEDLQRQGLIGAWGITGVGVPRVVLRALEHDLRPAAVQVVANLLDSPGGMRVFADPPQPRRIIAAAKAAGVGVMGIRAVQAGALTGGLDRSLKDSHPESADYRKAAPYRALCAEIGVDPAVLAHRYALGLEGVDTVVLGVKNRQELAQCLESEAQGPLPEDLRLRIDALGLREAD